MTAFVARCHECEAWKDEIVPIRLYALAFQAIDGVVNIGMEDGDFTGA